MSALQRVRRRLPGPIRDLLPDPTDRGRYTITLNANQVRDVLGNTIAAQNLAAFSVRTATGTELVDDPSTLLLLRMDGDANGTGGQTPTTSTGVTFAPGIVGQAADLEARILTIRDSL